MPQKKIKCVPDFHLEKKLWKTKPIIAGVDEAGRGPIAGPVVASAVIADSNFGKNVSIDDSKKLSSNKREDLYNYIIQNALSYGIAFVDNSMIEEINILQATQKAMREAVEKMDSKPGHLLIDGNYFNGFGIPYTTVVKGDTKSISIAAASILAKVERDRWMVEVADKEFPDYGFAANKGYGTKKHFEAVREFGICPLHRKSFLRKFFLEELEHF